uniref:Uncharacterized protein n=1 Tax=Heterorhabditis bacteriophora TaxID=37862 RepID=A0A1I7W8J4_HETBA
MVVLHLIKNIHCYIHSIAILLFKSLFTRKIRYFKKLRKTVFCDVYHR